MEVHIIASKEEKEGVKRPGASFSYSWQPSELHNVQDVMKFMDSLPSDLVPRLGTPGAMKRLELIARQRPPHDFDLSKCHPLSKVEKDRYLKFVEKRAKDFTGNAVVAKVEPAAPVEICNSCGEEILHGEFYVYTEMHHAGPNLVWHPKCFRCLECKEFIADFKYLFRPENDGIYCGRCHGNIHCKRCHGCDELIFNDAYTEASDFCWHKEHFSCWYCDIELGGRKFIRASEKAICCVSCYNEHKADVCETCRRPISVGEKKLKAKGKYWHESCFECFLCRDPLKDKPFYTEQGKTFCSKCIVGGLATCASCDGIIGARDRCVVYEGFRWHGDCFKCSKCSLPLAGEEFVLKDKKIRCSECYRKKSATGIVRCIVCKKEIIEKGLKYKGNPYHPDCFNCASCKKSLTDVTPVTHENKVLCKDCQIQLFGMRCTKCVKPIRSKYVIYKDRPFHRDCFTCTRCNILISSDSFYESQHGDFFCDACAVYA